MGFFLEDLKFSSIFNNFHLKQITYEIFTIMTDNFKTGQNNQTQEDDKSKKKPNEEAKKYTKETLTKRLEDINLVINSHTSTTSHLLNLDSKKEKKGKTKSSNSKSVNNPNEPIEKGFSIKDIIEKEDGDVIRPHDLCVLTDEIIEEADEELCFKKKKDILLSKLMCDKSIINDRTFSNSNVDNILSLIYLSLSPESRKLLTDKEIDPESLTFFHHLIGFNQENFIKDPMITNETLLYLCNNVLRISDLFKSNEEEPEKKVEEDYFKENIATEVTSLYNNLIFEDEIEVESPKEIFVEIRNESNLEITKNEESKVNESGMNALVDFIKQSQNKPIIEKVENLIGVFEKNQLDNKKINIDNKTKNDLLSLLRQEFQKEKEVIDEETKQLRTKINQKTSNLTSENDLNVTNQFTKNVIEGSNLNDINVMFANKGWGVNNKQSPKRKSSSTEKNVQKEQQYKKNNAVVKKLQNNKNIGNKYKEDKNGYENNYWIGDQVKNDDEDSDDWMVIK